jgi:hypothetical protein
MSFVLLLKLVSMGFFPDIVEVLTWHFSFENNFFYFGNHTFIIYDWNLYLCADQFRWVLFFYLLLLFIRQSFRLLNSIDSFLIWIDASLFFFWELGSRNAVSLHRCYCSCSFGHSGKYIIYRQNKQLFHICSHFAIISHLA